MFNVQTSKTSISFCDFKPPNEDLGRAADYSTALLEELRDLFRCPDLCPHCEAFACLSYLGFMSATSVTGATSLLITVLRYRCGQTGATVSLLPDFAQPYRLLASELIEDYFFECGNNLKNVTRTLTKRLKVSTFGRYQFQFVCCQRSGQSPLCKQLPVSGLEGMQIQLLGPLVSGVIIAAATPIAGSQPDRFKAAGLITGAFVAERFVHKTFHQQYRLCPCLLPALRQAFQA